MQQLSKKHSVRIWGLGLAVAMIVMVGTMTGSCTFDTKTNFCEQWGLRCKEGQQCAVSQPICINIGGCGNGIIDNGEACDDGNLIDGEMNNGVFVLDQCNRDCTSTQECGNGIQDMGEACDHGKLNGTTDETCDLACHLVSFVCGNGVVDQDKGEQCDPGDMDSANCNSNMAGAFGCKASKCGDGYPNMTAGEKCDSVGIDTEQCVGASCQLSICGDNFRNAAAGEDCDSGSADTPGCNGNNAPGSCKIPVCGDGHINKSFTPSGGKAPENCDNPDGVDTTTCNGNNNGNNGPGSCRSSPSCGDGYTNTAKLEECDNGVTDSAMCNGSTASSVSCKLSICGDGHQNPAAGEKCEPQLGGADTSACNGKNAGAVSCHTAVCGDSYTNLVRGETCDKGPDDTDMCNGSSAPSGARCKVVTCGDNYVNLAAGEVCDSAAGADTNTCNGNNAGTVSCHLSMCGDGYINARDGEQCEKSADCAAPATMCAACKCI